MNMSENTRIFNIFIQTARGGPDMYTDTGKLVIKKRGWPKASFNEDKRSMR